MAIKPVSVSQLNSYIKRILQTDPILGNVSVIGEISNLKFHSSGHVYFSLKDENSKVNCFLPAGNVPRIAFDLTEGMEVTAIGYIYLYERGGSYSINIREMEAAGQGDLAAAFEKLKKKLETEGLFDPAHKKKIPAFPHKVAIVTSETGAAVRDILKIIKQKNNYVDILIYPVLVQGPAAPRDISAAIDAINESHRDVDVIIAGRGGGSAEELWAFNEEIVARSIYRSDIPVISAVGHETDFTIADFVADLRAETPTAAAEKAVPDMNQLREYVQTLQNEMKRNLRMVLEDRRKALEMLNPQRFGRDIQGRLAMEQLQIDKLMEDMDKLIRSQMRDRRHRIDLCKEILDGADPDRILKKGYSVVRDEQGMIIRNAALLKEEQMIHIQAAEGFARAIVRESGKEQEHDREKEKL